MPDTRLVEFVGGPLDGLELLARTDQRTAWNIVRRGAEPGAPLAAVWYEQREGAPHKYDYRGFK